uniref:PWT3 protein n=1 Tax=Pyricularia grisea TaxID=148305 RepID=A0A224A323_PYRGI|nr:PWT3 [Pyricularia grisea]
MDLKVITFLMAFVASAVAKDYYKVELYEVQPLYSTTPAKVLTKVGCGDGDRATLTYTVGRLGNRASKTITIRCRGKNPRIIDGGPLPSNYKLRADPISADDELALTAAKETSDYRSYEALQLMNKFMDVTDHPEKWRKYGMQ